MESAEREDHLPNKDPGEASAQEPQLKDEGVTIGESSGSRSRSVSPETAPPPLPPRLKSNNTHDEAVSLSPGSPRLVRLASKQNLQPKATTSLSLADISTHILPNGSRETHSSTLEKTTALQDVMSKPSFSRMASRRGSEAASIRSYVPNASNAGEVESIFGDFPGMDNERTGWNSAIADNFDSFDLAEFQDEDTDIDFSNEFEPIGELDSDGENEEMLLEKWKAKRKHFFILSAAGKPIYTSHGDDHIISSYVGIIQTIISFYQESDDALKSFSAGGTKFVIVSQGALYLVAVSRLLESDSQLRIQLEALYMQILSTLTLPALTHLFSVRPSTDLRRPLQGTESLLSSLADSFTRGSPSTLLSALECLKIRKSHRQTINNTLLKTRVNSLLYGLVVAGGRLVSVVRPKKHSLHPGDLQLIFNMVFEAGGVKAGGGENWIPICLPGFNSSGYLYMYVSFLDIHGDDPGETTEDSASKDDSIAIVLISADKEGFFELQEMRNIVVEQMGNNGSINVMKAAVEKGRPQPTDIVPGTVLRHFLYKSKANVQFTMSSYQPDFSTILGHRRLLSIYHTLHASIHAKQAHVRVHHNVSKSASSLAWATPTFELYCVAGPNANRNALSQSAGKIVQWVRQEEERVFIIGGAVF